MIDARRMLRSVFRRLNCSAVSLTTFDSPSAISLRSIGVISNGELIVATRRSIATLPGGWVFDPPLQASNARSTKLRELGATRVGVDEGRLVGDQVGIDIRPEQAEPAAHRVHLDVRKGDRMARDRGQARRPAGQLQQLVDQRMAAVRSLLERAPGESIGAGPPGPVGVPPDLAGLDLDHEDAALGIPDHDVRLSLADTTVFAEEPADVGKQRDVHRQDRPKAIEHEAFGDRALRLGLVPRVHCVDRIRAEPATYGVGRHSRGAPAGPRWW